MNDIQPGYKQTEVGVIPDDWEVEKLKDIVSKVIDNRGKTPPYSDNADIELIESTSISFVNQHPNYSKITKFVSEHVYKNWFRGHPEKNDILISTVGEYSGSSALMKENRGTVAQNLIALRLKGVNSAFVFYWTRSEGYKKQLNQVMMSQAQPSLRVPWLLNFVLMFPPTKVEQEAIAEALSDADALIESLEQLIIKKRHLKLGSMQQLLTGKKRLPGFSDKWEMKKLGELGTFLKGNGVRKDESLSGDLPCIRYGEIYTKHNDYIKEIYSWISLEVATTARQLKQGDLLFAGSGETKEEIGKCVAFISDMEAYAGGDIVILRLLNSSPTFLGYYLNTAPINKQKASRGQGDAVVHISADALSDIEINIPKYDEQTAIANILSEMDTEIAALETQLTKMQSLKQGMMHNLLTGRIRLV